MFRGIKNIDELLKKAEFQGTNDYHFPDNPSPSMSSGAELPSTTSGALGNSLSKSIGKDMDHKKPEEEESGGLDLSGRLNLTNGNPAETKEQG